VLSTYYNIFKPLVSFTIYLFFDSLTTSASPSPYQLIDNNANFYISTEHIQNVDVRLCNKRHTDRLEKRYSDRREERRDVIVLYCL